MNEDILTKMMKRRSIREFTGESIKDSDIEYILKAAMTAPSGHHRRPWKFLVIKNRQKIFQLAKAHKYAKFADKAGVIIILFGDKSSSEFFEHDLGAATQNILLAVSELDLGATWCGIIKKREQEIRPFLDIPEQYTIFSLIPIGVPSEFKEPRVVFEPDKIFYEHFSEN